MCGGCSDEPDEPSSDEEESEDEVDLYDEEGYGDEDDRQRCGVPLGAVLRPGVQAGGNE